MERIHREGTARARGEIGFYTLSPINLTMSMKNHFLYARLIEDEDFPPEEPKPIAICTPMYNSMKFINRYLHSVTCLDYPRDLMSLYFTVQGDDGTIDIMKRFKAEFSDEYRKIKLKKMKQVRHGDLPHVRNVVFCRNNLVKWSKPDPVIFIDHDNFPPPVAVKRLLDTAKHGGDISAGVYVFYQRDKGNPDGLGRVGFTAFYIHEGIYYHSTLDRPGAEGYFSAILLGRRVWVDATSMGTTLIQRKVFNDVKFTIPWGLNMTDDTRFCIDAGLAGYKIIADFGLFVPHWGFNTKILRVDGDHAYMRLDVDEEMANRRTKMYEDGVYVTGDEENIRDFIPI